MMDNHGLMMVTRPGKRLHNELENHHAINEYINYFYGHFPYIYICLPEGIQKVNLLVSTCFDPSRKCTNPVMW